MTVTSAPTSSKNSQEERDASKLSRFFGDVTSLLRIQKSWPQEEVAAALSDYLGDVVPQSYVSRAETRIGKGISTPRLMASCDVLEVSVEDFIKCARRVQKRSNDCEDAKLLNNS